MNYFLLTLNLKSFFFKKTNKLTFFYNFFIVNFYNFNNFLKFMNFLLYCNLFYLCLEVFEFIFFINLSFFRFFILFIIFYLLIYCKDNSFLKYISFNVYMLYYLSFFIRIFFFSDELHYNIIQFFYPFVLNYTDNISFFNFMGNSNIFLEFYIYIFLIFFLFLYINKNTIWSYDYILTCFFLYLGSILLINSSHYLTFFLSLEIISFSTYILIGFNFQNLYSSEASLKYFILSAISSSFFLMGLTLIYYSTGSLFFWSFDFNLSSNFNLNFYNYTFFINKIFFGHVLILLVLFFKIGLAPFHFWVADVYEGSSLLSMGLLMFVAKSSYFFSLIKFYNIFIFYHKDYYLSIYIFFSIFSVLFGVLSALRQKKLKRFLAYTSVVNVGYISLLLLFNFYSGIFYFYFYMFFSFLFFFILAYISLNVKQFKLIYLTDLNKLNINNFFIYFFIFFAAIPPSPLFFFKLHLFINLFENGYTVCLLILIISSLFSLFYYLRLIQFSVYKQLIASKIKELFIEKFINFFVVSNLCFIFIFFSLFFFFWL